MLKENPVFLYDTPDELRGYKIEELSWFVGSLIIDLAKGYADAGFRLSTINNATRGGGLDPEAHARRIEHSFLRFRRGDVIFIPGYLDFYVLTRSGETGQDYARRTSDELRGYREVEFSHASSIEKLDDVKPDEIIEGIALDVYKDFTSMERGNFMRKHFPNATPVSV